MIPVEVEAGSVLVVGGDEGTLVDDVKVLVVMGVEVVDVGAESVLVGVEDDVTDGGVDITVVTGWLELSLGGVAVVVCSASVVVAGEVVLSAGAVLEVLVAREEVARDVAGMVVEGRRVAALWVVADVDVLLDTVAEFVTTLEVVPVLWVVGEDGLLRVGVGEGLDSASVELRSLVELSEPVVLEDVDSVVAGVGVEASVPTEDGGTVVDVCGIVEPGWVVVNADVAVLPGE